MKKKNFFLSVVAVLTALTMTSCLSDKDESDNTYTYQNYFTITGTNPNYKLYSDGGGIITPSTSSVNTMTSSKGFGDYKRAYFYMSYTQGNYTEATETKEASISNATLLQGFLIETKDIISKQKAELNHVMDSDSIAYINDFAEAWASRGYITIALKSDYMADSLGNKIMPTTELVYDSDSIADNKITLTVCYNRHKTADTKKAGISSFITSYDASALSTLVPGTGDITVKFIPADGGSTKTIEIPRSYLKFEEQ